MADSDRIIPLFKLLTERNEKKSREAGRPIFDDKEVVEVRFAANKQTVGVYPAHSFSGYTRNVDGSQEAQTYAQRWPDQYRRFKEKRQQVQEGTPLEELAFLAQSKRMELKALSIHTAETLAAIDGQELKNLGIGGRELKNQAQAYLDNATGSAVVTRQAAEIEDLKAQIEAMRTQPSRKEVTAEIDGEEVGLDNAAAQDRVSRFNGWESAKIKDWIKEKTGTKPQGNPSHDTLVSMADELDAG